MYESTGNSNFNPRLSESDTNLARKANEISQNDDQLINQKSSSSDLTSISKYSIRVVDEKMAKSESDITVAVSQANVDLANNHHSDGLTTNSTEYQRKRMNSTEASMMDNAETSFCQMRTCSERNHRLSSASLSPISNTPVSEICSRGFADTEHIRVPIIGYEIMEERARFTVFKLRVENPFTNDCWLVLRRYTDFVRLHNKMKALMPCSLNLPRKKLFGNNFNSVFLDSRVKGLQHYINTIMANEQLTRMQIVREFFCLDEPPTYSDSVEECRAIFEAQEETIAHLKLQLKDKDDLIETLKQKLSEAVHEKNKFQSAIEKISESCTKCSIKIDDCLEGKSNVSTTGFV